MNTITSFLFILGVLLLPVSALGILVGLIKLIFDKEKKEAFKTLIFSAIGLIIGFGTCTAM